MSNQWDADLYAANTRFVSDLGMPVVELLNPQPDERILDLGCGDGALTAKLVPLCESVVGIDPSENFIVASRELGLDARLMDARSLEFDQEFDAVFTNAVLHWIPQASLVAEGVFRSLKPGGRFVGEFGGFGNIAAIMTAIVGVLRARGIEPEPHLGWFYPTPDEYSSVLSDAGFVIDSMELIPRPTPLPTGMSGWLQTMRGSYLREKLGDQAEGAQAEIVENLRFALCDQSGNWSADYVRLRFKATKPKEL
jgi:trans-aconitate methyltransferase